MGSKTAGGAPLLGSHLGEYLVEDKLGEGGMGIVYKGLQPLIGKVVAIKVLRPEVEKDPDQLKRLLSEARAVNAIRHRGIVDIFSFGQVADGRHYFVMEFLEGESLDLLIHQLAPLPPRDVLLAVDEMLAALGAA